MFETKAGVLYSIFERAGFGKISNFFMYLFIWWKIRK